jgi:hypothetical protein
MQRNPSTAIQPPIVGARSAGATLPSTGAPAPRAARSGRRNVASMTRLRSTLLLVWMTGITAAIALVAIRDAPVAEGAPAPGSTAAPLPRLAIDELDVRRINVIEPDGKPRVIISSKSRLPGTIFEGKDYPHPGRDVGGGLLFFNDEGTEAGGLTYHTAHDGDTRDNAAALTIDQYDQNEQLALTYTKAEGRRSAGLWVYADLPETSLLPVIQASAQVRNARTAADKAQAQARLRELAKGGIGIEHTRVFVGKEGDDAKLVLGDKDGHPRIVLAVDGRGTPRFELLDAAGTVVKRITAP